MSRRARKRKAQPAPRLQGFALLKARLPQVLAGLLATGAVSGTGAQMLSTSKTATSADERAKASEVRLDRVEKDAGQNTHAINRLDRRTTRIETLIELELDQHKVPLSKRPPRPLGPEE